MKPKLLVVELWGLGDLIIATPFLQAASERFEVTLLAKPYAQDLQARYWRGVKVIPVVAPWTAFTDKYRLFHWPWRDMFRLRRLLAAERFEFGLSAHAWGDPRDHLLLLLAGAKTRIGFPRMGSRHILARRVSRPDPRAHRYESWRVLARALDFELPLREQIVPPPRQAGREILVHTGAAQPVRVWPLDRYQRLIARLRHQGYQVRVACDPDQQLWWRDVGETGVDTPETVPELFALIDRAGAFIGNDSGPGHLAAFDGVPSFTLFGPQLPEWFAPLHPAAEWLEGKACPYKPCSDYCRFAAPCCMLKNEEPEVTARIEAWLRRIPAVQPQISPGR